MISKVGDFLSPSFSAPLRARGRLIVYATFAGNKGLKNKENPVPERHLGKQDGKSLILPTTPDRRSP
jgi:hypothetical protein